MKGRIRLTVATGLATFLGASALTPLWDSFDWLRYVLAVTAAVTAAAVAARRLSCPAGLVPIVNALAVLLLVSVVFGQGQLAGILPTGRTFAALGDQLDAAFADIQQLAVPVPARRGLLLVTVLGVGLVATVMDALAVTLRRVALAGLPMLALIAVPTAIARGGVGWMPFVLGAGGYLFLLITDQRDRISHWGRPFTTQKSSDETWRPDPSLPSPLAAVGRRIAIAAIGLALVVPVLLPGLGSGGLYRVASGQGLGFGFGRGGSQSAGVLNPLTELRGQLHRDRPIELLRVRTNDSDPFYLRATALDVWQGSGWTQDRLLASQSRKATGKLPAPLIGDGVPTKTVRTRVQVKGLGTSRYLPVYATPTKVTVTGDWRYDRRTTTIFSTTTNTRDLTYSVTSVTPQIANPRLLDLMKRSTPVQGRIQEVYGAGGLPRFAGLDAIVHRILLKAKATTPYARILALYTYFHDPANGFVYSLTTRPGTTGNDLLDFLQKKQGYCEQYASAMAVMARYAGVPARVALGYAQGAQKNGYWSISTADAHAWVEVYFDNIGWVPWDPTPRDTQAGGGHTVALSYAAPDQSSTAANSATDPRQASRQSALQNRLGRDEFGPTSAGPAQPPRRPDHTRWIVLGATVAGLLLVAPAAARAAQRRARRRRGGGADRTLAAHACWDELLATATDLRLPIDPAETPRVTARRLARDGRLRRPGLSAVLQLAQAEERARYAAVAPGADDLTRNLRTSTRGLVEAAPARRRLLAALFPQSALGAAGRGVLVGVATAFDRLDAGLARLHPSTFHQR